MGFYAEPAFFVLLVPVVAAAATLGLHGRRLDRLGMLVSLGMLYLLFFRSVAQLAYVALYLVGSLALYATTRRRFAQGDPHALAWYRAALVCQILPLAAYKVLVAATPDALGFLGISYITFKAVQVLIETRDGLIGDMTLPEYLYFLAFFPTFTSGPILRSRSFVQDVRTVPTRARYVDLLYRGLGWFVVGACYKFVGSALAQWALWFVPTVLPGTLLPALSTALFYGIDLFFDFAGYSNMALGLSLVLGIEAPRNFHLPFLAPDIKEFWNRWHISLSTWLRDFVFMRFSRLAMERKFFASRHTTACVAFMLDMLLMGVWHGLTPDYLAYGLYHGLLLAGCHYLQQNWPFYKRHRRDRWFVVAQWALTMVAVFFGFALFGGYVVTPLLG